MIDKEELPATKNDLDIVMDAMEYRTNSLIENIKSEIMHFANAHCSGDDINIYDVFKVIDDCCEAENSTIKNDLGVSSELEKNSKKLEKDFGELDCIKKSDAINIIQDMHGLARADVISDAVNRIIATPSVIPQEPKTGHWINKQHLLSSCSAECSSCHERSNGYVFDNGFSLEYEYYDFCPKCGADMREVQE